MKKNLIVLVGILVLSLGLSSISSVLAEGSIVLDPVLPGSLSTWQVTNQYPDMNPVVTRTEIVSPYDGTTAIKSAASGNTYAWCESHNIAKVYDVGSQTTDSSYLQAYLEFWSDGTYYNAPLFIVNLLDSNNNVVGGRIYYGKGTVGGYLFLLSHYTDFFTELPTTSGFFTLNISNDIGHGIAFSKIKILIWNYACIGNNYVVFDQLVFNGNSLVSTCTDNDNDGYSVEGGSCGLVDCNDNNAAINPGATEVCDNVDNDCDGLVDEENICAQESVEQLNESLSLIPPQAPAGVSNKINSAINHLESYLDFIDQGKYCDALGKLDAAIDQIQATIDQTNAQKCSVKQCKGKSCCIPDADVEGLIQALESAKQNLISERNLLLAEHPECT